MVENSSTPTGRIIQRARKAKNWTQAKLAGRVGVTPEYISHIERGIRTPAVDLAKRIADALDVEPERLVLSALAHQHPEAAPFLAKGRTRALAQRGTRRLKVIVERDPEASLWVTYVPALGHLSTYGHSKREALLQTREAIRGYFEAAEKAGIDVGDSDVDVELTDLEVSA
jgi:transcriptional regulator with XRE-family HTH domain